jgi:hypothetical protein
MHILCKILLKLLFLIDHLTLTTLSADGLKCVMWPEETMEKEE